MYTLQLTQRGFLKPTYQVELFNQSSTHTRIRMTPGFDRIKFAKEAYNGILEQLQNTEAKEQLLTYNGPMYAQQPSVIHIHKRIK